ncbi:hypothetical protein IHE44_0006878 [Lamprotornis superbus]|uniref:Target of myb1 like 1 membrane trafficking protein n=1 Tax=Lamprotornis superbus TaxID=245042 RepID=A0A835NUT1_9PASS|nr:hypothetical protein IHE44_0006878 [Lamprotornis superbus]
MVPAVWDPVQWDPSSRCGILCSGIHPIQVWDPVQWDPSSRPKDAVKALKKKLSKNCNHKEIRLTLSLLEMCMENCGPRFQSLVVKKDFCKDKLVKLLNPRFNLPIDMQEKILTFIMISLCAKSSPSSASPAKRSFLPLPTSPTLLLTPEQIGKLYSELDMAKMNVRVMSSILKDNVPGSENPDDMNLLQKLYKTCRMMQERIMELLVTVENEDVIVELIQVNEDLNNVLLGHERFSRNRVRFLEKQRIQREQEEMAYLHTLKIKPGLIHQFTHSWIQQLLQKLISPSTSKNKSQSPHYYDIMEFDPLAPTDGLDSSLRKQLKIGFENVARIKQWVENCHNQISFQKDSRLKTTECMWCIYHEVYT